MKKDLFFSYHEEKKKQEQAASQERSNDETENTVSEDTMVVDENSDEEKEYIKLDDMTEEEKKLVDQHHASEAGDGPHPVDRHLDKQLEHIERVDPHPGEQKKAKTKVVKSNQRKISFRGIVIGCSIFGMAIVGGASFILYSMLTNPDQNWTLIPRETGQILLVTFASVFFGVLFFLGFGLLTINAYRLFTVKKKNKLSYILGSLLGFIILGISIGGGIPVISEITANNDNATNNLIDPYVQLQDDRRFLYSEPRVLLIAPTKLYYKLNDNVYKLQVVAQLGPVDIQGVSLSCGNGQTLGLVDGWFGPCLYIDKGPYPVSLTVTYRDRVSGEQKEKIISLGELVMDSTISISSNEERITLNDNLNEQIIGTAPVKFSVDGQNIITDFGLRENTIQWDTDEDGSYDIINNAQWTKNFLTSKLHRISYVISGLSPYSYVFDVRVLQPDVPVCEVKITQKQDTIYNFNVSFLESETTISEYAYQIINPDSDTINAERKSSRNSLDYDFTRGGDYAVRVVFITDTGKEGSCESDNFRVGNIAFTADFDLVARLPEQASFDDLEDVSGVSFENDILRVEEIPTNFKLILNEVRPRTEDIEITVEYDARPLLSTDGETYDFSVETAQPHTLAIKVRDKKTDETTTIKALRIDVNQEQVVGRIAVQPDTVGTEPFTVKLDASVTSVNDPEDQIVYFTRDFGDGDIKKNISQGIVEHTYTFDPESQEGTYYPQVTITTKKGREITATTQNPIIVKKAIRDAKINFLSHPAQLAKVAEPIVLSVTTDGVPENITWIINDDTIECPGRQCMEVSRVFEEKGTYDIRVRVSFDDHPDVSDSAKIKIQE